MIGWQGHAKDKDMQRVLTEVYGEYAANLVGFGNGTDPDDAGNDLMPARITREGVPHIHLAAATLEVWGVSSTGSMRLNGKLAPHWAYNVAARALLCFEAAQTAGFRGDDAIIMATIGIAESGGRWDATNVNGNGTTDWGPFQVNSSHGYPEPDCRSFERSAAIAYSLYLRPRDRMKRFGAWYAYTNHATDPLMAFGRWAARKTKARP